jgi:DNA-binding CsgD family transcriptional regulator
MNLIHFVANLKKATTDKQAEAILQRYLAQSGFRSYAVTYYSGHTKSGQKMRYDYVSEALRPWHLHYLEQAYADVDRTLEENHTSTLPMLWDVDAQRLLAKNKREQRIREESIAFGIHKGLSIPVHGPEQDFVTLTLHQFRGETCLDQYETKQFEWMAAAQIFYHYIRKILHFDKAQHSPYHLTRREEQCLALTAKSWRVEQIAKELHISARTVNFHLQNANKKLGTNNKYQASYKYFG